MPSLKSQVKRTPLSLYSVSELISELVGRGVLNEDLFHVQQETAPRKAKKGSAKAKETEWEADKKFEETAMKYLEHKTTILEDLKSEGYVTDKETQLKGIDFYATHNNKRVAVDVKSIAAEDFHTFCFEVAGNRYSGQIGWLINDKLETDYYLVTYHDVENYGSNYSYAKYKMTEDNINRTVAYLIKKETLMDLIQKHIKSPDIPNVVKQIRNMEPNYKNKTYTIKFRVSNNSVYPYDSRDWKLTKPMVYFAVSPKKGEVPINIVVRRSLLEDIAERKWEFE